MSYLLVASIDFGTTYSGYAFSNRSDYLKDPMKIYSSTWPGNGRSVSMKTSSCVLFDQYGKFHSFGFEAEDKYSNLALDNEHDDWYYFRRFKMLLYGKMNVKEGEMIEDDKGKPMKAMKVFSAAIGYLKDHMMQRCRKQLTVVEDSDIRWVLTVPAIWNDSAKQFMRQAAENAGILTEHLIIALEPEAASIFCKHIPVTRDSKSGEFGLFKPYSKYLVLDAGGGTIDITIHEVQKDQTLKELYKANGGDWGGTKVDGAFHSLLADIVGNDVMEIFGKKHKIDYLDLLREFEVKKSTLTSDLQEKITFKVPINLSHTFRSVNSGSEIQSVLSSNRRYKDKISWVGDKLRIEADLTKDLFDESCRHIVRHLRKLLKKPQCSDVTAILMVGGFSDSPILQNAVEKNFPNMTIIVPQEAVLAVLKGAVLYGHEPKVITSRVCKMTYGVSTNVKFKEGIHPESKREEIDGVDFCVDIFNKHVEEGQIIDVGKKQKAELYTVTTADQTEFDIEIWGSTKKNSKYVTDAECTRLGTMTVTMPNTRKGLNRGVYVSMTFSGTEIEVEAVDRDTKRKEQVVVKFLG